MNTRSNRRRIAALGIALAAVLPLAACAGGNADTDSGSSDGGSGAGGTDPDTFTVMTANENPVLEEQLTALSEGACEAENEALPLEHQKVAQADTVQKVTLLASQGALPTHTIAGTALIRPDGDLNAAGLVGDLKAALEGAGTWDNVLPAAASTVEQVYGGDVLDAVPVQHRGDLLQQGDPRRQRHRRAPDLG